MKLAELAAAVPGAVIEAGGDVEISGLAYDSRAVGPGDLFVAVRGLTVDGHSFLAEAAGRAAAVAVERMSGIPAGTPTLRLPSTRRGLAELAAAFYGWPSRHLKMAGVTGTDGKTTTTHLAAHLLDACGLPCGAMSTVSFMAAGQSSSNDTGQTTIEAPELQAWLRRMADQGLSHVVVEVTSHALVQQRVGACDFDVAAFTYIGRDHLDYHRTWEDYIAAKGRLIDVTSSGASKGLPKTAVLNRDDASYDALAQHPIERRWSYSLGGSADIRAVDLMPAAEGWRFQLATPLGEAPVHLPLLARFNVYNALCAAGICLALGADLAGVAEGFGSFRGVPGRLQRIDLGQSFTVYVDFAHSAGSLASALAELRPLTENRLIAVFGTTARSDHDRPGMGRAAALGSDFFIITTDDPVDEDPAEIAREVAAGVEARSPGKDYEIILDRRTAIRHAIELARPGDVVLLAGKGHERSMVTAKGREPWDEVGEAEAAIREVLRA